MGPSKNRQLTPEERVHAHQLLGEVRKRLDALSGSDADLRFAYNRFVYLRLNYDERGNTAARAQLKDKKLKQQDGRCAACGEPLARLRAVLDRLNAMKGYTLTNTRLIHADCDYKAQEGKGYA